MYSDWNLISKDSVNQHIFDFKTHVQIFEVGVRSSMELYKFRINMVLFN